ncbi:unnamed protein product [Trichobilharzia szidati]|nr:unnamed protein product [Trichobilharzia szidati]
MDKTEIITKTDDTTVVKRKKSSKFGRFLSHLKRKSHHTSTATTTSLSSVQQPSTASVSSINTHHTHGCSTFSNWFNKNKENVHDKRSTVKHKKYKEVQGTVMMLPIRAVLPQFMTLQLYEFKFIEETAI